MKNLFLNILVVSVFLLIGCETTSVPDTKALLKNNCVKPGYPLTALENNLEGTVVLQMLVTANGDVGKINIVQSSGSGILDNAAVKVMSRCTFVPATKNAKPVDFWFTFNYTWALDEKKMPE